MINISGYLTEADVGVWIAFAREGFEDQITLAGGSKVRLRVLERFAAESYKLIINQKGNDFYQRDVLAHSPSDVLEEINKYVMPKGEKFGSW